MAFQSNGIFSCIKQIRQSQNKTGLLSIPILYKSIGDIYFPLPIPGGVTPSLALITNHCNLFSTTNSWIPKTNSNPNYNPNPNPDWNASLMGFFHVFYQETQISRSWNRKGLLSKPGLLKCISNIYFTGWTHGSLMLILA